jgi:glutamine synthetase
MFFCAAVVRAVDEHQALLRASVANAGQDHRLGANEAPPAIISIFLGAELERAFASLGTVGDDGRVERGTMELGTPVLPRLPMHGGDRNRTSPFAFTGNKFEFRALGSSMSLAFPNTVLNTIVAESIDAMSAELSAALDAGTSRDQAVSEIVARVYEQHKRICFDGDGYSDEWQEEAARRGLENLRTTPDALPWIVHERTTKVFSAYNVLSERELESRYEVLLEQYVAKVNIEAETAAAMARTLVLPAAVRHLNSLKEAALAELVAETRDLTVELFGAIQQLEEVNADESHPDDGDVLAYARYMRDSVIPAMDACRDVADRLENVVADDLWPLPKYEEMLFIK